MSSSEEDNNSSKSNNIQPVDLIGGDLELYNRLIVCEIPNYYERNSEQISDEEKFNSFIEINNDIRPKDNLRGLNKCKTKQCPSIVYRQMSCNGTSRDYCCSHCLCYNSFAKCKSWRIVLKLKIIWLMVLSITIK